MDENGQNVLTRVCINCPSCDKKIALRGDYIHTSTTVEEDSFSDTDSVYSHSTIHGYSCLRLPSAAKEPIYVEKLVVWDKESREEVEFYRELPYDPIYDSHDDSTEDDIRDETTDEDGQDEDTEDDVEDESTEDGELSDGIEDETMDEIV